MRRRDFRWMPVNKRVFFAQVSLRPLVRLSRTTTAALVSSGRGRDNTSRDRHRSTRERRNSRTDRLLAHRQLLAGRERQIARDRGSVLYRYRDAREGVTAIVGRGGVTRRYGDRLTRKNRPTRSAHRLLGCSH